MEWGWGWGFALVVLGAVGRVRVEDRVDCIPLPGLVGAVQRLWPPLLPPC